MTDTYKLTCDSEDGAHDFKTGPHDEPARYTCRKCGTVFMEFESDDVLNAAAREIKRLELERDAYRDLAFDNDDEIGRVTVEKDATIAELREQLARVRVSPTPLSEAREELDG